MRMFAAAFYGEALKTRRARAPWLIAISFLLAPIMGALFMFIIKNPEQARSWGIIGTKAQFAGSVADWPTYFGLLAQAVAVGGAFVFAMMTAWIFGREFADATAKEMLATPTSRAAIITAKFTVLLVWSGIVTSAVLVTGLAAGKVVSLPGWSADSLMSGVKSIATSAALTFLLMTVVAFVASIGRGYLASLGWTVLAAVLAQVIAALGWGPYFPWSLPALASGVAGPDAARLHVASYLLVVLVSIAGVLATLAWWHWADHTE